VAKLDARLRYREYRWYVTAVKRVADIEMKEEEEKNQKR